MWRFAGMGFELAAAIIGFTLIGYWIDHVWNTKPTFVLVGALLGLIGGFWNFLRESLRLSQSVTKRGDADRPPRRKE